jgi:DNA anti-recombination protein RmuC
MVYPAVMDDLNNRDDMDTPEITALRKPIDDRLDKTKALLDARFDHVKAQFDEQRAHQAERLDQMERRLTEEFRKL